MAVIGLRHSGNFAANQRPNNWREGILRLDTNGMLPLTGLTSLLKSKSTDDPKFNWFEQVMDARRYALHATAGDMASSASATTITLASSGGALSLKDGDILLVEQNGEQLLVDGDPSSDTSFQVIRAWAGTSLGAALDANGSGVNPNLKCIGSAYEEASAAPSGVQYDPETAYNYTQIFRQTVELSRTASKTRLRTGDAMKEAKHDAFYCIGNAMEWAFLMGGRNTTTRRGKPITTTGGIKYFLDSYNSGSNVKTATTDYGSGVTYTGLMSYMKNIFDYGSSQKMCLLGNTALATINAIVKLNSTMYIEPGITEFGMAVTKLVCPFGELILKTHPLFNQVPGGTNSVAYYGMDSWMFVLDMKNLVYRYIDDLKYQPDLQANGVDGKQAGWIAEVGLEVHHPRTHYLIKNLVAAAAG